MFLFARIFHCNCKFLCYFRLNCLSSFNRFCVDLNSILVSSHTTYLIRACVTFSFKYSAIRNQNDSISLFDRNWKKFKRKSHHHCFIHDWNEKFRSSDPSTQHHSVCIPGKKWASLFSIKSLKINCVWLRVCAWFGDKEHIIITNADANETNGLE